MIISLGKIVEKHPPLCKAQRHCSLVSGFALSQQVDYGGVFPYGVFPYI
jgi:hypothetical protein